MNSTPTRHSTPRWLAALAMILVLVVVLSAFALSFTVLRDLAALSGIPSSVAWLWPVIVDGTITAATVVLYTARGAGRSRRMPMATLILFGLASVVGNVAHILMVDPSQVVPAAIAVFVGIVPPVGLIATVEILGGLLRTDDAAVAEPEAAHEVTTHEPAVEAAAPLTSSTVEPVAPKTPGVVATESSEPSVPVVEDALTVVTPALVGATDPEPVAPAVEADAAPVVEPEFVADAVVDEVDEADDGDIENPSAPVTPIHQAVPAPVTKAERIDHIISLAESGKEILTKDLAEQYGATERSVQRYLKEARQKAPEAFADAKEAEDLVKVS